MNHTTELKIQGYLDGELSASDARQAAELIGQDPECRELYHALSTTRELLRRNEPEYTLGESRAFYWSKILREITRESEASTPSRSRASGWPSWWIRFATGGAIAALLATLVISPSRLGRFGFGSPDAREIESPLEDFSAISFHSESSNMTVVWVQSRMDAPDGN